MSGGFRFDAVARRLRFAVVLVLITCGALAAPISAQPLLTENRMAIVDGKPRFLLGLYENPKDDAVLKAAVEAGFNLIQSSGDRASLDRIGKHGAKAWVNLGGALDLRSDSPEARAKLLDGVNRLKDHPALIIWEGPDEALWNVWYASHLNYLGNTEFPEMSKAIKEAQEKGGLSPEAAEQLYKLRSRCHDLHDRGLWARFDEKRAEFWQRVGRKPPQPSATMADRAEQTRKVGEGMTRGMQAVRQADPKHLIWLNHAPRNSIASMQWFNRAADMAGCDIYPVPVDHAPGHSDLRTRELPCVGEYTERMRAAAPGKACAMVLQGFGWRDIHESYRKHPEEIGLGRRPNFRESRFMAYDAIVHGVNAIMYWGTAYIEKDSQLWKDLLRLARELGSLEPALVAPSTEPEPKAVSEESYGSTDGDGIVTVLKHVGDDYVLLVVNERRNGLAFTVGNLPAALNGKKFYRLGTDEEVVVTDGALRDGIRSTDVHVYATSRRFESK
ncbi:MAG: hypothetical protein JXQ73_14770 [Phycisphaerae bacterium]|nr:hypothetical protein [Phycisphaerae bacterium]